MLPHLNKDDLVHGVWRTRGRAFELGPDGVELFYAHILRKRRPDCSTSGGRAARIRLAISRQELGHLVRGSRPLLSGRRGHDAGTAAIVGDQLALIGPDFSGRSQRSVPFSVPGRIPVAISRKKGDQIATRYQPCTQKADPTQRSGIEPAATGHCRWPINYSRPDLAGRRPDRPFLGAQPHSRCDFAKKGDQTATRYQPCTQKAVPVPVQAVHNSPNSTRHTRMPTDRVTPRSCVPSSTELGPRTG